MKHEHISIGTHHNKDASGPLHLTVLLACNTSDAEIEANVRTNSARADLQWLKMHEPHKGIAIVVGGGPSAADHLDTIKGLMVEGGTVFGLNRAASWLGGNGILPDCQIIIDAQPGSVALLDKSVPMHILASQVHPDLANAVNPVLMHLSSYRIEDHLPEERKAKGDYVLVGGGCGVGNSAACAVYVLGFREIHCFGFDSSHRDGKGHAYAQPENDGMLLVDTEWNGTLYTSSLPMKGHAEKFQVIARDLQKLGCEVHVHGDGLLPAMWNTPQLSERDKYRLMWATDMYRESSPGERLVDLFLEVVKPDGKVIDFGCGPGRASLRLHERGVDVILVDFADNSRDEAAKGLPFIEADLTQPIPADAPYGFCCDVMEHIPPGDVSAAIRNIMASAQKVFFQISTRDDEFGALIGGAKLHLTIEPAEWWRALFLDLGFSIAWQESSDNEARFVITR